MATKKLHYNVDKIFKENKKHCTGGTLVLEDWRDISVQTPSATKNAAWLGACVFGPKEIG